MNNRTIAKSNETVDVNDPNVKNQLVLYDVLIPSLGALIILLNLAVVISSGLILKKGQQPRTTYLFLGNVAMTDLITGVAVIFGQLYPKEDRDHYVCAIQVGMIVSSTISSVYSVGLIAIDRFLYIIHGLQYQKWVYPTRARLLILFTWILGCLIGFMPLFGWYGETENGRICWFIRLAPKNLILLTVIVGLIPLAIVIVLYSIILYHAIKKIVQLQRSDRDRRRHQQGGGITTHQNGLRLFRGGTSNAEQAASDEQSHRKPTGAGLLSRIFQPRKPSAEVKSPSRWRAIKVVMFTSLSFVITWSPYFIASIMYVYQCENIDSKRCKTLRIVIASPLAILGFTNSLINPIIYAWWHKGFRHFVQKRVSVVIMRVRRSDNAVVGDNNRERRSTTTGTASTSRKTSSSTVLAVSNINNDKKDNDLVYNTHL